MSRRRFAVVATGSAFAIYSSRSDAQTPRSFDDELAMVSADPSFAETAAPFREDEFRQIGPSETELRGNNNLPRRWVSDKPISPKAALLIIAFEVTSEQIYSRSYAHPIWPKGSSGITVGIGYDLGYKKADDVETDWLSLLGADTTKRLQSVRGLKGSDAQAALGQLRDIEIGWNAALTNFRTMLRFYAGETIRYFINSDELTEDSFGALVSLVYNRGSATSRSPDDPLDRRLEMREIKQLCLQRQFDRIPDQIRKMRRLWENDKSASGLIKRRELEARLFEAGLK